MKKRDDFQTIWKVVSKDNDFLKHCKLNEIDETEQKYIVVSLIHSDFKENKKCGLIDMPYMNRPHRTFIKCARNDEYESVNFIISRILTRFDLMGDDLVEMSDMEILQAIISDKRKPSNERMKAIDLKKRIIDDSKDSSKDEAWRVFWREQIIPHMFDQLISH